MTLKEDAPRGDVQARWAATAGSVAGAEHLRLGRNNQDGTSIGATPDAIAVVVTDGCSGGRYSEVGARLAAEWLSAWAPLEWRLSGERADVFAAALTTGLAKMVRRVASRFGLVSLPEIVADYFLFTFLVAVVGERRGAIVGAGDGVFVIDDEVVVLDPGPENAPRYVAYQIVVGAPSGCGATVHRAFDIDDVDAIMVATDGAVELEARAFEALDEDEVQGGLRQFVVGARYRTNPSLLHKRLQVIGRRFGRLADDTTVATLLRREVSPCGS